MDCGSMKYRLPNDLNRIPKQYLGELTVRRMRYGTP